MLIVIILLVCVLLILVVLVQNSKGGGLASNFSGSNQVMGVRKTADFLEKATWTLAITLFVLSVITSWSIKKRPIAPESRIDDEAEIEVPFDPNTALPPDYEEYPTGD